MDLQYCEHANDGKICQNLRNDPTQEQFYGTCALNCYVSCDLVPHENCSPNTSSVSRMNRFHLKDNKSKSKYHNEPVTVDGVRFDGKNEMRRFNFLKLMEKAGEISNLRYHVKFELIPQITREEVVHLKTKDKIVTKVAQSARYYEADFVYLNKKGEEIVEDFKGQETDLFKFKAALFRYKYGIEIKIVKHINELP